VKKEKSPAKSKYTVAFNVTALASFKPSVIKSAVRKLVVAGLSKTEPVMDSNEQEATACLAFSAPGVSPVVKACKDKPCDTKPCDTACETKPAKVKVAKKPRAAKAVS
jgi:hypothetical protein